MYVPAVGVLVPSDSTNSPPNVAAPDTVTVDANDEKVSMPDVVSFVRVEAPVTAHSEVESSVNAALVIAPTRLEFVESVAVIEP